MNNGRAMMKKFLFCCFLSPTIVFAAHSPGIGEIAENMLEPINIVSDFVGSASLIVGICALLAAFLKYMQHRVNPLVAPMSTIVVLVIIGIVLICLPFVYLLTEHGIPYHLS